MSTYIHKRWICSVLFILIATCGFSQKKPASIWASATFNKKEVMVGEPLVVTVTVCTSTWFTQPPVFEEIQVKGSLMARLEQRSGSKMVKIGNKQYPAIEQRFVIYPTIVGENILPSFKIKTTCPPEGDFKGVQRTIRSKERTFNVLAPPEGVDTSNWLSSYKVTLSETWDRPLENLKAGDVLERRIRVRASGTLAAFISPTDISEIEFGKTYPKTPILANIQNSGSFTGSRTDIISYLIEKDGSFTIPEIKVPWFNLNTKKQLTATLDPIDIEVAANPDLAFILSRQKALQEELAKEEPVVVEEEEPFELFGLNWWQLALVILAIIAIVVRLVKFIKAFQSKLKQKKEEELASEGHYFQLLQEACEDGDSKAIVRQLFFWYDRFRGSNYAPEIEDFIIKSEDEELSKQLSDIAKTTFEKNDWNTELVSKNDLIKNLSKARKNNETVKKMQEQDAWLHLNPN